MEDEAATMRSVWNLQHLASFILQKQKGTMLPMPVADTHVHNGILLSHKKTEIMSSAATCMDLEVITRSQRKTNIV